MCGIAGIVSLSKSISPDIISNMSDTIRHRGPDDEGYLALNTGSNELYTLTGDDSEVDGHHINSFNQSAHLFLAHRRLSIIDPTPAGHQPMCNKEQSVWIIYNGEIYNYIELRVELEALGHVFKTHTDTEVLLTSYEEWGRDCLCRLNGMWAFVIYDRRKNILFGARDRFGVKPFYYYLDRDHFTFASEIKAIAKLPFVMTGINPEAVFDYLVLGYQELEEEGFFANIFELPPSFAFQFDLSSNQLKTWKYYELNYTDRWETFNKQNLYKYTTDVRELLYSAITLRLRSDVPVGSCLSGGIDSSAIVGIINKLLEKENIAQIGDRQKVFTASYDHKAIDESAWANMVVERTNTSWYRTFPAARELLDDLEDLIQTQDIPFGSTSIYAQYRVMKIAGESGVKVLLDGQGGDEVFTGYSGYHSAFAAEMLRHLDILGFIRELRSIDNAPLGKKTLFLKLMDNFIPGTFHSALKGIALKAMVKENSYIQPDFWRNYCGRLDIGRKFAKSSLNGMLHDYMTGFNLKTLLRYEDRNSMRFSIESRTPFADDINLIEYVFRIPSVYKIHKGWSKYLLRESTAGLVPDTIRARTDKIGFATPEHYWLYEIRDELKEYLSTDIQNFVNVKKLFGNWNTIMNSQAKDGITTIWRFINFAAWKQTYGL